MLQCNKCTKGQYIYALKTATENNCKCEDSKLPLNDDQGHRYTIICLKHKYSPLCAYEVILEISKIKQKYTLVLRPEKTRTKEQTIE